MDRTDAFHLTAPCGLDCFNCEVLGPNLTDEGRRRIAARLHVLPDQVACRGCRERGESPLGPCPTRSCVHDRGLTFCSQCDDFPCARLQPARDGAATNPQNLKLFNLCRIQAVGVQRWAEEEAATIRRRYFDGVYRPGHGPTLPT